MLPTVLRCWHKRQWRLLHTVLLSNTFVNYLENLNLLGSFTLTVINLNLKCHFLFCVIWWCFQFFFFFCCFFFLVWCLICGYQINVSPFFRYLLHDKVLKSESVSSQSRLRLYFMLCPTSKIGARKLIMLLYRQKIIKSKVLEFLHRLIHTIRRRNLRNGPKFPEQFCLQIMYKKIKGPLKSFLGPTLRENGIYIKN